MDWTRSEQPQVSLKILTLPSIALSTHFPPETSFPQAAKTPVPEAILTSHVAATVHLGTQDTELWVRQQLRPASHEDARGSELTMPELMVATMT